MKSVRQKGHRHRSLVTGGFSVSVTGEFLVVNGGRSAVFQGDRYLDDIRNIELFHPIGSTTQLCGQM